MWPIRVYDRRLGEHDWLHDLLYDAWLERLFLAVPRGCLRFVIVVFLDHTHLLFLLSMMVCHCGLLYVMRLVEPDWLHGLLYDTQLVDCDKNWHIIWQETCRVRLIMRHIMSSEICWMWLIAWPILTDDLLSMICWLSHCVMRLVEFDWFGEICPKLADYDWLRDMHVLYDTRHVEYDCLCTLLYVTRFDVWWVWSFVWSIYDKRLVEYDWLLGLV